MRERVGEGKEERRRDRMEGWRDGVNDGLVQSGGNERKGEEILMPARSYRGHSPFTNMISLYLIMFNSDISLFANTAVVLWLGYLELLCSSYSSAT
jgi:hypothetical protein